MSLEFPRDSKLLARARRERWPITDETKLKINNILSKALDHPDIEINLKATNAIQKFDALNLKEMDIKVKSQPKVVIHTKMTTEDLEARAKELMAELNISANDAPLLLEAQNALVKRQEIDDSRTGTA